MKYAGELILILSSTGAGLLFSLNIKKKINVCRELIKLCDTLLLDLEYRITPAPELLENALKSASLCHLDFIYKEHIMRKCDVNSALSKRENEELSQFLFSLGKSNVESQKKLIKSYREYVCKSLEAYSEKNKKDSKIYVSFGFFFACVLSIIWS